MEYIPRVCVNITGNNLIFKNYLLLPWQCSCEHLVQISPTSLLHQSCYSVVSSLYNDNDFGTTLVQNVTLTDTTAS